jgi:hypothetical protein
VQQIGAVISVLQNRRQDAIIEVPAVQDTAFMETLCDSETIKAFSFVFQESLPRGLRHFKVVSKNSISM